jgi:hypothetical protein
VPKDGRNVFCLQSIGGLFLKKISNLIVPEKKACFCVSSLHFIISLLFISTCKDLICVITNESIVELLLFLKIEIEYLKLPLFCFFY